MIRGVTSSRVCDNQPSGVNDTRSYAHGYEKRSYDIIIYVSFRSL
jgi:hypothetical protein